MRIVYMGTPDFAVPALESIIDHGHVVAAVVTQPDKPKGRGKEVRFPPVKLAALRHNITVYQPIKVRDDSFIGLLREISPDAIVVAAFGQILPQSILEIPKYGCINIHASLLPKYRGAAPIQQAILNGDEETGITTMFMETGLDTGDILDRIVLPIAPKETGESLHDKLAEGGSVLINQTLDKLEQGTAVRIKQDDNSATYVKMLTKQSGKIDFNQPAAHIERQIRALNAWPSAYTFLNGKTFKIWDADVIEKEYDGVNGEIVEVKKDALTVKTGDGALSIREVQFEGKKRMTIDDFLRGCNIPSGTVLS